MENYGNFHTQLVSIVEVLANTAVLEICKLVDDGFTHLRLEVSRTQRENLELKSKLRLMGAGAPVPPPGSCSEKGGCCCCSPPPTSSSTSSTTAVEELQGVKGFMVLLERWRSWWCFCSTE